MKLSEAILKGIPHIRQKCYMGYFALDESDPPTYIDADTLLTALVGTQTHQWRSVYAWLGANRSNYTGACMQINRALWHTWPILGAQCPAELAKAAKIEGAPRPKPRESLHGYLSRANDVSPESVEKLARVLERAGL